MLKLFLGFLILAVLTLIHPASAEGLGVSYQVHVQNAGWGEKVADGVTAGTVGEGLRLEGIKIELTGVNDAVDVAYRTHVQDMGWQDYVHGGELSGTEGQAKRLEAIEIKLDGESAADYSVWYCVHAQDFGWLDWTSNGNPAGTEGMSKRLEAIAIKILPAGNPAPGRTERAFITNSPSVAAEQAVGPDALTYRPYMSATGWNPNYSMNGEESGGDGRIEALQINLSDANYQNGGIMYRAFSEAGWTGWVDNNNVCGQAGVGLQALRVKLAGKLAYMYDVYYRVHVPNIGWSNWARNGAVSGSEGFGRNISLVQILLTGKAEVPGQMGNAYVQGAWQWPVAGHTSLSSVFGPRNGTHHDGIDIPAGEGTPIVSAKTGTVILAGPAGNFGNCVAVEHDSGEVVYYAHMVRVGANVGQRVSRGEVIGYVGNTGNSYGSHLHMEVYDDSDNLINPLTYY